MATFGKKNVDSESKEESHRIRITLTSRNVESVEKLCKDLKDKAQSHDFKVRGPVRMPTKILRITTRRTPCGQGTNSWDRYQMRIHKRVLDVDCPIFKIKEITDIRLEPDVDIEVSVA